MSPGVNVVSVFSGLARQSLEIIFADGDRHCACGGRKRYAEKTDALGAFICKVFRFRWSNP